MSADQIVTVFVKNRKAANETARAETKTFETRGFDTAEIAKGNSAKSPSKGPDPKTMENHTRPGKGYTRTLKYGRMIFFGRKAKLNTVS